jgi:hypothetical protein
MGVDGAWWLSWSSKPVRPDDVGLGGFDSHTLPPPSGVSPRVKFSLLRFGAAVTVLCGAPLTIAAQRPDTARAVVAPPSDSGIPEELKPPISARRAFLSSLLLPGYGQSVLGRTRSGAMMLAMEAISVAMIRESALGVREAKRNAADSNLVAFVDASGNVAVRYERGGFTRGLIKARKEQVEDWVAMLIGNHLFSATDALVAALLWDLPAEVSVGGGRNAARVGLKLKF